jgi:GDP-L-fucose synthase
MRVLVTGASGFLGKNVMQHLPKFLEDDYSISGIGSKPYDLISQNGCRKVIEYYNPDVIVHAAGSVGGIAANQKNPGKFMYENMIMGANLIEEARRQNVPKFVFLGTVCSYPKFSPVPFKESDLWNGYPEETNAGYGVSKKAVGKLLQLYGEQYGMRGANLLLVNMYGPHDHFNLQGSHVIPALILKFYNAIKNGEEEVNIWGTGQATREFLYVEDCVEAISLAIKNNVDLEPINIGTGREIKIIDLVSEIADIMEYEGWITYDETKPDGQPRRCLYTSLAESKLGFKAKTHLHNGLKQTIEFFLNNNKLED